MKITESNMPVKTIPQGVWESSRPDNNKDKENKKSPTKTNDLQGNGYPVNNKNNIK